MYTYHDFQKLIRPQNVGGGFVLVVAFPTGTGLRSMVLHEKPSALLGPNFQIHQGLKRFLGEVGKYKKHVTEKDLANVVCHRCCLHLQMFLDKFFMFGCRYRCRIVMVHSHIYIYIHL